MHCKSLWIKASAKCMNINVSIRDVFQKSYRAQTLSVFTFNFHDLPFKANHISSLTLGPRPLILRPDLVITSLVRFGREFAMGLEYNYKLRTGEENIQITQHKHFIHICTTSDPPPHYWINISHSTCPSLSLSPGLSLYLSQSPPSAFLSPAPLLCPSGGFASLGSGFLEWAGLPLGGWSTWVRDQPLPHQTYRKNMLKWSLFWRLTTLEISRLLMSDNFGTVLSN